MIWAKIVAGLLALVKPLIAFFIYLKGKRDGYNKRVQEQNAINAKVRKRYEEIETEDRSDGPWIK